MPKIRSFLTFAYGTLNSLFMWSLVVKFLWNTDKYIIIILCQHSSHYNCFCSTSQIKKIPFQGVSIPRDNVRGWFTRRSRHVKVDFTFLLVKSEVQSRLVILKSRLMLPAYFCHMSFMKMLISCLLKSIVFIKYFESHFLEK